MGSGSGWRRESHRHRLAGMGIKTKTAKGEVAYLKNLQNKRGKIRSTVIEGIIYRARREMDNTLELTEGYCVEFARALKDMLDGGENYQILGHNVIYYDGVYYDGRGAYTKEELELSYQGGKLRPDPDGWSYIYNIRKLEEYRGILEKSQEKYLIERQS